MYTFCGAGEWAGESMRRVNGSSRAADGSRGRPLGGGGAVGEEAHAAGEFAEVGFVAAGELFGDPSVVADFLEGFAYFDPVDVAFVGEFAPLIAVAFEIFDVEFEKAGAEGADPVLGESEENDVADVEVGAYPGAVELVDVAGEFEGAQEEFVPDVFDGDDDFHILGDGDEFADVLLGTFPGFAVADGFVNDAGHEQNAFGSDDLREAHGGDDLFFAGGDDGGVGMGHGFAPSAVDNRVDLDTGGVGGFGEALGGFEVGHRPDFNAVEAHILGQFAFVGIAQCLGQMAELEGLLERGILRRIGGENGLGERRAGGEGSGGLQEGSAGHSICTHRSHAPWRLAAGIVCTGSGNASFPERSISSSLAARAREIKLTARGICARGRGGV